MGRIRTLPARLAAPGPDGRMVMADVMAGCTIHTVTLEEGSFAAILFQNDQTGKAAISIIDRDEVEAHITLLRNAMDDAERIDQGLAPLHAAPSPGLH